MFSDQHSYFGFKRRFNFLESNMFCDMDIHDIVSSLIGSLFTLTQILMAKFVAEVFTSL